jgi:hypothetical protein
MHTCIKCIAAFLLVVGVAIGADNFYPIFSDGTNMQTRTSFATNQLIRVANVATNGGNAILGDITISRTQYFAYADTTNFVAQWADLTNSYWGRMSNSVWNVKTNSLL